MKQQHAWIGIALAFSIGLAPAAFATELSGLQLAAVPAQKSIAKSGTTRNTGAASRSIQQGAADFKRGYIARAIGRFELAAKQDPGNQMAWLWLGRSYRKQGSPADFERAKTALQKVLSINPDNVEALSSLGELWSWDPARRQDAASMLKHAYDINPTDAEVAKRLSQTLLWQGNVMDALRYASPIANKYRNDRKFMADYAQMLSQTGHADQALVLYDTVLKDESGRNVSLKMDRARSLLKSGQKQQAQAVYSEIAQSVSGTVAAKDVNFIKSMAGLAFDLDLHADALKWDQTLPNAAQRQKDVQLRAARALVKVYRMPEAIERFHRLYEAGLLNVGEKLEYAEYLRQLHLEADAMPAPNLIETLYREAMQEEPDNSEVSVRLARYLAEEDNRFSEAVAAYQQAMSVASGGDHESIRKEFLDYLKTDKTQPAVVEGLFQQMLAESPDNIPAKTAYAEFLSWQKDRRPEALRAYVALGAADPDNRQLWEARVEEVLKWHQPTTDLISVYQEIVNLYPESKAIWLAVAKAYAKNKDYYREAVDTYSTLVKRYPDDGTIKREWLGLLVAGEGQRSENLAMLKKMVQEQPGDLDIRATYGKLLTYERRYGDALDAFEQVLRQNPEHREALVGKGYAILWSGRKFEAKEFFVNLRSRYPDDVDVAIGLAQTEKLIGRYDEAMRIIQEIRPLMQKQPESGSYYDPHPNFMFVENIETEQSLSRRAVSDFSILPYDGNAAPPVPQTSDEASDMPGDIPVSLTSPSASAAASSPANAELRSLQSEVDALTAAVESLNSLQRSARTQLDRINDVVKTSRDVVSGETSLQSEADTVAATSPMSGDRGQARGAGASFGSNGMQPVYGTYAALEYDTNPLLSGMGRFRNDELADLEKGLTNDLRPMFRAGYMYATQDGEATTTSMNSYGFPNQVSFSLTPQVRLRAGTRPTRYSLPNGVSPDSTLGIEYGLGGTIKYWDHLTLDGDFALTRFSQSKTANFTFQAQAEYAFTDSIKAKLGMRRLPQYNSLLSVAGIKPTQGAFAGRDVVGQARENSVYLELNTNPFSPNVDWNLGYEWAFVDGEDIPKNYKNQLFTSLGYTWHYAANHEMRLGYEFLYFGYSKNATNGYFDVTNTGLTGPVATLRPPTLANEGYVFGGYFSPRAFILNAGRLDARGSLFNKFLEYKLGGSIGGQYVRLGHGIDDDEESGSGLAMSFDANLIMNLTDWLALYGNVDYLDAGARFNRWRLGGGVIVRPHINALSPLIGHPTQEMSKKP